jgi:hypothetical protein
MTRLATWIAVAVAAALMGQAASSASRPEHRVEPRVPTDALLDEQVSRTPLLFEPNRGQAGDAVEFVARSRGVLVLLAAGEATFVPRRGAPLRMLLCGASEGAKLRGLARAESVSHYFKSGGAVRDVPHFGSTLAEDAYAGIDMTWRCSDSGRLEYVFEIAPGASAGRIDMQFDGASTVSLGAAGELRVESRDGILTHTAPVAYQCREGRRRFVDVAFALRKNGRVGFEVGAHDERLPLVIDPELQYGTFLGGAGDDHATGADLGADGSLYVTGETESANFPVQNAFDSTYAGGGEDDVFVAKFSPDGSTLVYSTYIGGGGDDAGDSICVDPSGNAYAIGTTRSFDFPTQNAVQPSHGGDSDAYVLELSPDGSALVFSTFVGGSGYESPRGIDTDSGDAIFVVGETRSFDFPVSNALQPSSGGGQADAWVMKLSPAGASVLWSTYVGGFAEDRALDCVVNTSDDLFVVGDTRSSNFPVRNALQPVHAGDKDAFVARVAGDGSQLMWATFFGGSDMDDFEGCALGPTGDIYGGGNTQSADFPTKAAVQDVARGDEDAVAVRISSDGQTLLYSTFIGGSEEDDAESIAVDQFGGAYLVGNTTSPDFPIASLPQPLSGGGDDAFLVKLTADGRGYVYTTYLGAEGFDKGREVVVTPEGRAFVVGETSSDGFPTQDGFQGVSGGGDDMFFARLSRVDENTPPPNTIRSFLLPKSVRIKTSGGKGKPKANIKCFFDTGPDAVDLSAAATLVLGTRQFDIPAFTPISRGKRFLYEGQGLKIQIRPSKLGSSKAVLNITYRGDLAGDVDLDGEFSVRLTASAFDALGTVRLVRGAFKFGKAAGQVVAPNFSIRKGKAKVPGIGKHSFKLVCAFSVEGGTTPSPLPDLRFAFGNVFHADIASSDLTAKGKKVALTRGVVGIDAFVLTYHKERFAVRGGDIELGPTFEGPQRLLVIFGQGDDVRAVEVRVVRQGKLLKY